MNPKLVLDDQSDLLLDSKALKAVIGAACHQLAAWEGVREADVEQRYGMAP